MGTYGALFGDLKRHRMTDTEINGFGNERVVQGFVDTNVFTTTELWGIGSTAPSATATI